MLNFFKKTLTEEQIKQLDQAAEKFKKNPHQFRFTVVFFLTSIFFGVLSIYLLQQKFALLMQKDGKVEIKEIIKNVPVPAKDVLEPTKEATEEASIINSWEFKKNEECNLLIPVSPYEISADEESNNKKWIYESMETETEFPFLNNIVKVHFPETNENISESLSPGKIEIYCDKNSETLNNLSLEEKIKSILPDGSNEDDPQIAIKSSEEVVLWGRNVQKISFSDNKKLGNRPYYIFTTSEHIYLIYSEENTDEPMIEKDLKKTFYGLFFLD
jgi:hypothetical protein